MPDYDYSKEFGSTYHGARRLSPKLETWISKVRAEKIGPYIKPTDRVLEYGVGFGWNLTEIQCADKTGFDLTAELRGPLEMKGIRFVTDETLLASSIYDKVICHHVLEHVREPINTLKSICEALKPGGQLLLFTPFERESKYRRFRIHDKAHHLYSWSPTALRQLLSRTSFSVDQLLLTKFRFDRAAAVLSNKFFGGFILYKFLRQVGHCLLPEYEIVSILRKAS